ncbi:uncharacterized protein ColSpa_07445 [Colletotrichum spaethianum]|uniref:DUF7908 domain-containing protein n=1 Tax=Colletotrichum spaethianum TaxID=700344 RepID=A0AA37LJ71_9PEZI|nr:uncharacterized protein ColSpa_07445 [Colletotrichum spaethianum]GKT47264.1 hypothetical protein ColSpa_07445 [Colletotrichum spaethianum]
MVWVKQAAVLAAASLSVVARANAIPDSGSVDFGDGAPLPSIPAASADDLRKRQTIGGFLDTDAGPPVTGNCNVAATFILNNLGQMVVGNSFISVNPGTPFIPLRPINPVGSISVAFSVSNGQLVWSDPSFFGGRAGFCQDTAGQVFATFADPAVAYPPNCRAVQLGSVLASSCKDGAIVSSSSSTTTTRTTTVRSLRAPSGPITTTPYAIPTTRAVVNSTLTLRPGLYTEAGFVNPAGASCRVVTESWVFGQTTLLPPRITGP